jgi:hypothetical protein
MVAPIGRYDAGAESARYHSAMSTVCPEAMTTSTQSTKITDVIAARFAAYNVINMASLQRHAAMAVNAATTIS